MRYSHIWQSKYVSGSSNGPGRTLADIDHSNIAEQLIDKGLANVLRHRRDDEDRSAELDKLIVAEQT